METAGGAVVVQPKPRSGMISSAIDWLEWAAVKLMHDPKQPQPCLSGNFAPVDETPPLSDLPVRGNLPVSVSVIVLISEGFTWSEWEMRENYGYCRNASTVRSSRSVRTRSLLRLLDIIGNHFFFLYISYASVALEIGLTIGIYCEFGLVNWEVIVHMMIAFIFVFLFLQVWWRWVGFLRLHSNFKDV